MLEQILEIICMHSIRVFFLAFVETESPLHYNGLKLESYTKKCLLLNNLNTMEQNPNTIILLKYRGEGKLVPRMIKETSI